MDHRSGLDTDGHLEALRMHDDPAEQRRTPWRGTIVTRVVLSFSFIAHSADEYADAVNDCEMLARKAIEQACIAFQPEIVASRTSRDEVESTSFSGVH